MHATRAKPGQEHDDISNLRKISEQSDLAFSRKKCYSRCVIVRIWKTEFITERLAELIEYAQKTSLPYLKSQSGNKGVLFYTKGKEWFTLTVWSDKASITKMEHDPGYKKIVDGINKLEVLTGNSETEIYEGH